MLKELYQSHLGPISDFVRAFPDETLHGPLLMDPVAYYDQPTKLLVVGQETGGWARHLADVEAQLQCYRDFNLGDKWPGPFWNITRKIESALSIEPCSCAWTNLNRFDHDGEAPSGAVLEAMPSLDFLLAEEIRALKPDVLIFFTNRKYDGRLTNLFPDLQFSDIAGLPSSHFARLTHKDLPAATIRTPHPRSIRMQGWEDSFISFIESLASTGTSSK
jgi:hypothetical protein